mmetsp:Transcript_7700/g.12760  ORF Transcript_7700/g.12760 Transcript_7700/m.12760 type:complete len:298 (+) Transcript_7700:90-983(+)|eukprot:CAMPEP_0119030358 /NCGR_PEP_ID=MMETSP1176-20130426/40991_1 /TAXON_ID=265551 /ORGANISM="Synedropsis recta cf, Strain CCMP1620" /LENGTH=297 /DNA_ID=CAMNT_0006986727 /DNA_START=92 /DNA_END=985 /DNA_ORIENTATION=+
MNLRPSLLVFAVLAGPAHGFVAPRPSLARTPVVVQSLQATNNNNNNNNNNHNEVADFLSNAFGVLVVGATLAFHPPPVDAVSTPTYFASSSSIQISAEIMTVDMSLPSYGAIADPNAKLDGVLTIAPTRDEPSMSVKKKKTERKKESGGGGGGNMMGSVLPSMKKKGPSGAKPRELKNKEAEVVVVQEAAAPVVAKKEAPAVVKKEAPAPPVVVKKEAPAPVAVVVKEEPAAVAAPAGKKKREKLPPRVKKEKAAVVVEKEEVVVPQEYGGNVQIVDMGLPSYSDSTATKDKSAFSF